MKKKMNIFILGYFSSSRYEEMKKKKKKKRVQNSSELGYCIFRSSGKATGGFKINK